MKKIRFLFQYFYCKQEALINKATEKWGMKALLIRPIIFSALMTYVSLLVRKLFPYIVAERDPGSFEITFILPAGLYLFVTGVQIAKVHKQKNNVMIAKRRKKIGRQLFIKSVCLKIGKEIHNLLAILSIIFWYKLTVYPFFSLYTTTTEIFLAMFILCYVYEVSTELDDEFRGVSRTTPEEAKKLFGKDIMQVLGLENEETKPT